MTREEAIHIVKTTRDWGELRLALQELVPEFKENEDERNWKTVERAVRGFITNPIDADELLVLLEKQKEQKHVQDNDEREYVRTLKSLISDFLRGKDEIDRGYYQKIYDWLDGRHIEQKPAEWTLPKDFEEAVYKVANFISPFDNQDELRETSHRFAEQLLSLAKKELDKPAEDWREKRKKECPFRRKLDNNLYGCEQYMGVLLECDGKCSWVVDYPKLKEIQDKKQKPEKIEPKFKVGDTLKKKNKDYTFVVDKIQGGFYLTSNKHFLPIEEQDSWELLERKLSEWSEEDESILRLIHEALSCAYSDKNMDAQTCSVMREWLNNRLKFLRPQPHWKPTEEQIQLLQGYVSVASNLGDGAKLKKLIGELKKL